MVSTKRLDSSILWIVFCALCLSQLRADAYFPHSVAGAVGTISSQVEIELSASIQLYPVFKRSARGSLRFIDQQGASVSLRVSGEGLDGAEMSEVPFEITNSGANKRRWKLEGPSDRLVVFWVTVEELEGEIEGQLIYDLSDSASAFRTVLTVRAVRRSNVNLVSLVQSPTMRTGFAVANPSPSPARYWLLAVDREEGIVASVQREIGPQSQEAKFVEEVFCTGEPPCAIQDEFDGVLALLSDKSLPLIALRQDPSDLELASTLLLDADGVRLPFAFGTVVDFLSRDVLGIGNSTGAPGTVSLHKMSDDNQLGELVQESALSEEGNFVLGPVAEPGQYTLRVEASGFCPLERPVTLPSSRLSITLTNLQFVNVKWLSATLQSQVRQALGLENIVVKATRQFRFRFDASRFDASNATADDRDRVEAVQRAFKMWVWYELPELRLPVDDGGETAFLGGRERYIEEAGNTAPYVFQMIVDPNLSRTFQTFVDVSDEESGPAIRRAEVRFNPAACTANSCALLPQLVTSTLWDLLFLRTDLTANGQVDPRDFAISGLPGETENLSEHYTQISGRPQSLTSTPVDLLYWAILRERPVGTKILPEVEQLPQ